jgi:hypothetical protein
MVRLDVLIMVSQTTPRGFVNEARRSARIAADLCPYPVNIIETPGVPGHIGKAMLGGLAKSTAGYIAFVDDDDFVLPNAFACLERHFALAPAAICAREIKLLANGRVIPTNRRHHLTAFHAEVARELPLELPTGSMLKGVVRAAELGTVIDELSWVYVYRIWRSAGLRLRAIHGS